MFEDILEGWNDLVEKPDEHHDEFLEELYKEDWDTGVDWDTGIVWNT